MNQHELTLVVHALLAVSPSGGGSPTFTLARKLMQEHNIEPNDQEVGRMIIAAANECPVNLEGENNWETTLASIPDSPPMENPY